MLIKQFTLPCLKVTNHQYGLKAQADLCGLNNNDKGQKEIKLIVK